jgi:uncharacterized membrane protein YbhN (UPF0104 family)
MKWTVEVFTGKLIFAEGLYVTVISSIGNYFGPLLGGATIRGVYLKKVHKLSYSNFISTLGGYYVVLFIVNCALAITSLAFLRDNKRTSILMLFFVVWLIALVALSFIKLRPQKVANGAKHTFKKKIISNVYEIESGWRLLKGNNLLIIKLLLLALAGFFTVVLAGFVEFRAIGATISLPGLGLYAAVSTASMLVSFTPGAIGIKESLLLLTSVSMGVTPEQMLQVAIIDRGISFFVLGLLYVMTHFFKPKSLKNVDFKDKVK